MKDYILIVKEKGKNYAPEYWKEDTIGYGVQREMPFIEYIEEIPKKELSPVIQSVKQKERYKVILKNYKDIKITDLIKADYFVDNFYKLCRKINLMGLEEFKNSWYKVRELEDLIDEKYDTYIYDLTYEYPMTFDNWVRQVENGNYEVIAAYKYSG